jgi:hypothetical protein
MIAFGEPVPVASDHSRMIRRRRRWPAVLACAALCTGARSARAEPPVVAVWHFGQHGGSESLWIRSDGEVDFASSVGRDAVPEPGTQPPLRASGRLSTVELARFVAVLRRNGLCHLPSSRQTAVAGQGYLAVRMASDLVCVIRLTAAKWKHNPAAAGIRQAVEQVITTACDGSCRDPVSANLGRPMLPEPATDETPPIISLREHVTGVSVAWCFVGATGKVRFLSVFDEARRPGRTIDSSTLATLLDVLHAAQPDFEQATQVRRPRGARTRYLSLGFAGSSSPIPFDMPFASLPGMAKGLVAITQLRTALSRACGGACLFDEVLRVPASGSK